MCHEMWAWRNVRGAQESRRDLWQEFEETMRRDDADVPDAVPEETRLEGSEETVAAR